MCILEKLKDYSIFSKIQNKKYLESIALIYSEISNIVWNDNAPKIVKFYTDHGEMHTLEIIKLLNILLENAKSEYEISEEEAYILIISAILHDIGLQCDLRFHSYVLEKIEEKQKIELNLDLRKSNCDYTEEEQNNIRNIHNEISCAWIESAINQKDGSLNLVAKAILEENFEDVLLVCRYHTKYSLEVLPKSENSTVKLKLLILLFRIADELDIGKHRTSKDVLENYDIPSYNAMHWYLNYICTIKITKFNSISMIIELSEQDYTRFNITIKKIIENFAKKNQKIFLAISNLNPVFPITFDGLTSKVIKKKTCENLPKSIIESIYYDIEKTPYTTMDMKDIILRKDCLTKVRKLSVIISFDRKDVKFQEFEAIRELLKKQSNDLFEIKSIFLKKSTQKNKKIDIEKADCIIILITNSYLKSENEEIKNEYRIIKEVVDIKENIHCCALIFDGNINLSDEMIKHFYFTADISKLRARKKNINREKKYMVDFFEVNQHKEVFQQIFAETFAKMITTDEKYNLIKEQMLNNFFLNTKKELFELPQHCLIKTKALLKVSDGFSYIIIGRKGSGKSTLVNAMSTIDKTEYKGIIRIKADEMALKGTFDEIEENEKNIIGEYQSILVDAKHFIGYDLFNDCVWDLFLLIYSIWLVYIEYLDHALNTEQNVCMKEIIGELKEKMPFIDTINMSTATITIYPFARNLALISIKNCIDEGFKKFNELLNITAHLNANFSINKIIYEFFSEKVINNMANIVSECKRKIFVTMDNFDVVYDDIRRELDRVQEEEKHNQLIEFERKWLKSFLEKISNIKNNKIDYGLSKFFEIMHFCICIPHDRFLEVLDMNRDAYKYNNSYVDLTWTGIELVKLLLKRLNALFPNSEIDKELQPHQALEKLLKNEYPLIPSKIKIGTNKKSIDEMDIFQYVLRMSFWRPRDILSHYATIITLLNCTKDNNFSEKQIQKMIERKIKETAKKIIKNEFITEYKSVITNIEVFIKRFSNVNMVLSWEELYEIMKESLIMNDILVEDMLMKFDILYDIGFIGYIPTKDYANTYSVLHKYAFVFNEKKYVLTGMTFPEFKKGKFILHPIFVEYLNLNINVEDLYCNYDWDYLYQIENMGMN